VCACGHLPALLHDPRVGRAREVAFGKGATAGLSVGFAAAQCYSGRKGVGEGPPARPQRQADWVCDQCQNLNFADRAFCNMRKCGAPRALTDWLCDSCGNSNYADRLVCNMRKCGAPRADVHPGALAELSVKGLGKGKARSVPLILAA